MKVILERTGPESWMIVSDEGLNLEISASYSLSNIFDAISYWTSQQEKEGKKWAVADIRFIDRNEPSCKELLNNSTTGSFKELVSDVVALEKTIIRNYPHPVRSSVFQTVLMKLKRIAKNEGVDWNELIRITKF